MPLISSPGSMASHTQGVAPRAAHLRPPAAQSPQRSRRREQRGPRRASMEVANHSPLSLPNELPLTGKRVMITAPRQYASRLAGRLIEAGAQPIWVPSIVVTAMTRQEDLKAIDSALENLRDYSHIAFTSANGITAVVDRLLQIYGDVQTSAEAIKASGVRTCAVGVDSEVLEGQGFVCNIVPQEASTQGLVAELRRRGEAEGARVLCPIPLVGGGLVEPPVVPKFLSALEAAGAQPVPVHAYKTERGVTPEACMAERALLESGSIDSIAFSSTAEAQGLAHALGGVEAVTESIKANSVILAAHGPYTAAGVGNVLGMDVTCVSRNFSSFAGLVSALEDHFSPPDF